MSAPGFLGIDPTDNLRPVLNRLLRMEPEIEIRLKTKAEIGRNPRSLFAGKACAQQRQQAKAEGRRQMRTNLGI